jgi:APA family basic amino acid/polyamine antiporter
MTNLSATKAIDALMLESQETSEHSLKRTLGPVNLVMLGIGAIIGAAVCSGGQRPPC